ncbi:MAG: hypothetical protein MUF51_03915 [Vicinamibacteria bacterium]|jgi:hypothetical protein|nr:hypothetical protein [Vicinamibacteria bacterium]
MSLATLWILTTLAQAAAPGGNVTLPLAEYEQLKELRKSSSVTVVDTLSLGGSFAARNLNVTLRGRAAGERPAVAVLSAAPGVVLYGCDGEGILSRDEQGLFHLTPLAPRFTVTCRLAARGSDRIELIAQRDVLWVESTVGDGEFVWGSEANVAQRPFSIVRRVTAVAEGLRPTAIARYRLSLRPEETRFFYRIEVHNPNRARESFDVQLRSSERVQQVDAQVAYDAQGQRYRFDLPPGEYTIDMTGTLAGGAFTPPVEAGLHYCLLESHPLVRPLVKEGVKRISPQETGLQSEFRGAQAFLLASRETLTWEASKLDALHTTGFAVNDAAHMLFLTAAGQALGETSVTIDNQGSPDIRLPIEARPTYASLQGETVLLTKDPSGQLWLPIAMGKQILMVQHEQVFRRSLGLAWARLSLPQLPVPATQARIEVRFPAEWYPLYWSFLAEPAAWTPSGEQIFGFLALFFWTERALSFLALRLRQRAALAGLLALTALMWGEVTLALVLADIAITFFWLFSHLRKIRTSWIVVTIVLLGCGVITAAFLAISIPSLMRARVGMPSRGYDVPQSAAERSMTSDEAQPGRGKAPAPAYQGLPAKIEIPYGVRRTSFSREMLSCEGACKITVVALSHTALWWLQALCVIIMLTVVWRSRRDLAAGWQARRDETRGATVPPASSSPPATGIGA